MRQSKFHRDIPNETRMNFQMNKHDDDVREEIWEELRFAYDRWRNDGIDDNSPFKPLYNLLEEYWESEDEE